MQIKDGQGSTYGKNGNGNKLPFLKKEGNKRASAQDRFLVMGSLVARGTGVNDGEKVDDNM